MADFGHCQRRLYFDQTEKISFTSADDQDHDQLHMNLKFSVKYHLSDWIRHEDSTQQLQLLGRINQPLIETFLSLNLNRYSLPGHQKAACETLEKEFENWPVGASGRRDLIRSVLNKVREAVKSMPPQHNSVYLHFLVNAFHIHVFDDENDGGVARAIQRSIEDDENKGCMVPAMESSIESLEKKKVMDNSGTTTQTTTSCSICLEDIPEDGLLMPCLHVFHEDCIKKWLRISHYCPICRFQMPINSLII